MQTKGKIIVIEGTDGSGKETQTNLLFHKLIELGYNVKRQSFPNYESQSSGPVKMYLGCELGNDVNVLDAYQASTLFAADRLCTMLVNYKDFLQEENSVLLFDRYVESNLIHQACKISNSSDRESFINWIYEFEYGVLKLPRPNLVFFLDMPIEYSLLLAKQRNTFKAGTEKDIHEQNAEYLQNAYATGKEIAEQSKWSIVPCVQGGKIRTKQAIHAEILGKTRECLCDKHEYSR